MKGYFAYIRVSTAKQGEGVSLIEQRAAIEQYASLHNLSIAAWFEETETAATRGRSIFKDVVSRLRRHEAPGLLIHKIDRSARNLRDWADMGELIDNGIDVRFVQDNLDLGSRGGRLAADIQAVIAADYIRNLRDEVKKGFYGRLKQGLYPLPAPLGYLDRGPGRVKVLDPVRAPLIAQAFDRYSTGNYTLRRLAAVMKDEGLTSRKEKRLSVSAMSAILHNPFYAGTMLVRNTGETFPGIHEPIISPALFERVGVVLKGRRPVGREPHWFVYRGLVRCVGCSRHIIGDHRKGHTYYRCHVKKCRGTSVREEVLDEAARAALTPLTFGSELETQALFAPLVEHWKREMWRHQLATNQGKEHEVSPQLAQALTRTHSAAVYAEEQLKGFRALAERPDLVFMKARPMQRRELVQLMTEGTIDLKTPRFKSLGPFEGVATRCDRPMRR